MTNTVMIILIVVVVVIVAAAIGFALWRKQQTERLKARFGPEYERSVSQADDRRTAEAELRQREKRHRELELRPLDHAQRERYEQRWTQVQGEFVDDPGGAVRGADRLVAEVMQARGYPEAEFDQRADDLSVAYPELTQLYREARQVARANEQGKATTEDLRHAVTTYRSLVEHLVRDGGGEHGHEDGRAGSNEHRAEELHDERTDRRTEAAERRDERKTDHGPNGRFPTGHEGGRTEEVQR